MRKMEKYIPNLILSVILIFSLLGAEGVAFAKYRVFNERVCIDAVESNDVTGKVLDSIEKYFENSSNLCSVFERQSDGTIHRRSASRLQRVCKIA